jgi:hypothetical protein
MIFVIFSSVVFLDYHLKDCGHGGNTADMPEPDTDMYRYAGFQHPRG